VKFCDFLRPTKMIDICYCPSKHQPREGKPALGETRFSVTMSQVECPPISIVRGSYGGPNFRWAQPIEVVSIEFRSTCLD
jgi:hypothetical protein